MGKTPDEMREYKRLKAREYRARRRIVPWPTAPEYRKAYYRMKAREYALKDPERIRRNRRESARRCIATHNAWLARKLVEDPHYSARKSKAFRQANPEFPRLYSNRRRVRKAMAGGSHTIEQWQKLKSQYGYFCQMCWEKEPQITLTRDHIVPLSKGGTDDITNIQPLCKLCNQKKYAKLVQLPTTCQIRMFGCK